MDYINRWGFNMGASTTSSGVIIKLVTLVKNFLTNGNLTKLKKIKNTN